MTDTPLVSICCITYNHEKYIRTCLDGFLMQQTNFKYEIVIHDDASSDNTQNIIQEYVDKYQNLFIPILQSENQYSKGIKRILATFCYPRAKGKYIAICEGDDYWTDPYKLQKQVDFLESHPDYSMCVTNYDVLRCNSDKIESWLSDEEKDLTMEDLIMEAWRYCATASMVYRGDLLHNMPDEINSLYVGDYPMCIYMCFCGKIRLLGLDHCCVYRYMSLGSWTAQAAAQTQTLKVIKENARKEIHMLSVLDRMTGRRWHSMFKRREHMYLFTRYFKDYPTRAVMVFWRNPVFFYHNFSRRLLLEIHGLRQIKKAIKNIPLFNSLIKRYRI